MPKTIRVKCTINKRDVLILNSIIDSYEGIGLVRTLDAKNGSVIIYSTEDRYETVLDVLDDLIKGGMDIRNISTEESEDINVW